MVESARITGQEVFAVSTLKTKNFDCLFIPGGVGATRNLSDWAAKGEDMTLSADVQVAISSFHKSGKYIGVG